MEGFSDVPKTFRGQKIVPVIETFRLESVPDIEVRMYVAVTGAKFTWAAQVDSDASADDDTAPEEAAPTAPPVPRRLRL